MRRIEDNTDDEADGAGNDDDDDRVRCRRFFISNSFENKMKKIIGFAEKSERIAIL